jgi:hypothetical protein
MSTNRKVHHRAKVTSRALLGGLLGCLIVGVGEPLGVAYVHGSPMAADFSTGAALFLLFLLSLLNLLLRRLAPRLALSPTELVAVYVMMIVACSVVSWGFMMNLLALMPGAQYFASPENRWGDLILPRIDPRLAITDAAAARCFYEGLRPGQRIPWGLWVLPLARWTLFALALYGATICIAYILRRQWVTHEKLIFPLTHLPLELAGVRQFGDAQRHFLANRVAWIGFAIPFVYHSVNALHSYYPLVPALPRIRVFSLFRRSTPLYLWLFFEVIGLSYLLTTDVSFSVWFFALFATVEMGVLRVLGVDTDPPDFVSDPGTPSVAYQGLGALIALVALSLWRARAHLREVWRSALSGRRPPGEGPDALSYRFALLGAAGGLLFALLWLHASGIPWAPAAVMIAAALVLFTGLSRVVAQAGLAYARPPVSVPVFTLHALGSKALGRTGLAAMGLATAWSADVRTLAMTSAANGLKMSDASGLGERRLFGAMLLAILAALAGTVAVTLPLAYHFGGSTLGGWHMQGLARTAFGWVANMTEYPVEVSGRRFAYLAVGVALCLLVSRAKDTYSWFPLHPVGLTLGLAGPFAWVWFSVFIAWALKAVILKYAGGRGHQTARPFFLGLILGSFTAAGVWLILDAIFGGRGNTFTLT